MPLQSFKEVRLMPEKYHISCHSSNSPHFFDGKWLTHRLKALNERLVTSDYKVPKTWKLEYFSQYPARQEHEWWWNEMTMKSIQMKIEDILTSFFTLRSKPTTKKIERKATMLQSNNRKWQSYLQSDAGWHSSNFRNHSLKSRRAFDF